jgi:alanine racemase
MEELDEALNFVKKKNFELRGVFSHLCCADEENNDTFIQYKRFEEVEAELLNFVKKII